MKTLLSGVFVFLLAISTVAQTGGQFAITQPVIANGGGNSAGGNFSLAGTTAQTTVGVDSPAGGSFTLRGGFWQPVFAPPTAALVSLSGTVTTADGTGIGGVRVTLTDQTGESATALTNSFGSFSFTQVRAGEIYVVTVASRRYQFGVPTQVLSVSDEVVDLVFIANLE